MAAVDYFLKINGISGESLDDKHKDEIQLESWSWGETNAGSHAAGGGGGAGKVNMHDFSFTMPVNKATPLLFQACATGKHIPDATLVCRKAGTQQQEYLKIKFTDLLVSSYQTGGSSGDVIPMEQVAFNFSKIEFTYAPQNKDGSLGAAIVKNYDLKAQKAG